MDILEHELNLDLSSESVFFFSIFYLWLFVGHEGGTHGSKVTAWFHAR